MIKKTISIIVITIIIISNNITLANLEVIDNNLYFQDEYTDLIGGEEENVINNSLTKVEDEELNPNREYIVMDKVEGDSTQTVYVDDYLQETEEVENKDNTNKELLPIKTIIIKQNEKTKDKDTVESKTNEEDELDKPLTGTNIEDLQGCPVNTEQENPEEDNKTMQENEQKEDETVQTNQDTLVKQNEEKEKQINDVIKTTSNVKKLPRTGM